MHGKDISIPKGAEITAYVNGNFPIDVAKFQTPTGVVTATGSSTELDLTSEPAGAEVSTDGSFVGNTPSTLNGSGGPHSFRQPGRISDLDPNDSYCWWKGQSHSEVNEGGILAGERASRDSTQCVYGRICSSYCHAAPTATSNPAVTEHSRVFAKW